LEQVMGVIVPKGYYDKKGEKMNNIEKFEQLLSTDMSGCEGVYECEMAELLVNRFAENFGLSLDEVETLAKAKAEGRLFVSPVKVGDNVYYETYENGESVGFKPHAVQDVNLLIRTDSLTDVTEGAIGVSVLLNEEDFKKRLVPAKVENGQCPCCGRKQFSFEAKTEYCSCCHQRFDWSEE